MSRGLNSSVRSESESETRLPRSHDVTSRLTAAAHVHVTVALVSERDWIVLSWFDRGHCSLSRDTLGRSPDRTLRACDPASSGDLT